MSRHKRESNYLNSEQLAGYFFLAWLLLASIVIALDVYGVHSFLAQRANTFLAIVVGGAAGVFVYLSRDRMQHLEYQAWQRERKRLQKNKKKILKSHPILSSIPILGFLFEKWKVEPLLYKLALGGLSVLAVVLYMYDLSYYDWLPDEPLVVSAAKGYLETGKYTQWDFWMNQSSTREYDRAWVHTWMVAQSFKLFGVSEWSARIVSVVLGVITVPIMYGVSYFFLRNRLAALIATLVFILHPYPTAYFRRTRMYALFLPSFILLGYLSYQSLVKQKVYDWFLYKRYAWVKKYLNYNWGLVVGALFLLYFVVMVHKLGTIILPILFLFVLYLIVLKKQIRLLYLLLVSLFVFGIIGVLISLKTNVFLRIYMGESIFTFFQVYKTAYVEHLFLSPFQPSLSISFLLVGLVMLRWTKRDARWVFLYLIIATTIVLFVFVIDYSLNNNFRYIMHLIPFACMLVVGIVLKINNLIAFRPLRWILPIIIVVLSVGNFSKNFEWIYRTYPEAQFSKRAYPTILNNIQPEKEGVLGLYLQKYYMQGWGDKIVTLPMLKGKKYTLELLKEDLAIFEGTWVTWATHKSWHLRPEVIRYINKNCRKYHGHGIDDTLIEVYYCGQK